MQHIWEKSTPETQSLDIEEHVVQREEELTIKKWCCFVVLLFCCSVVLLFCCFVVFLALYELTIFFVTYLIYMYFRYVY